MSSHPTLSVSASAGVVQELVFAADCLPILSGWAARHSDDLSELAEDSPRDWPLTDRLFAQFLPEMRPSVYAFHIADGPDLSSLIRNPALRKRLDSELVQKVHDSLTALWVQRAVKAGIGKPRAARKAKSSASSDGAPDVEVTISRGQALVSIAIDRAERWTPERRTTALAVCAKLFSLQRGFLESGFGHLVPLSQRDLAREVGMHESTVSRQVKGLRANTPHGIVDLREMFSAALEGTQTTAISARAAKQVIAQLVTLEQEAWSLTDGDLAALLRRHGIVVARRTVAKYRAELRLPSAHARRRSGSTPVESQAAIAPDPEAVHVDRGGAA